ncbi:MAG: FtsX-like permease family protein [Bacteroidetes bacterium]|nr:FtsX-like permease family protein [Bacteroidota bacterium]
MRAVLTTLGIIIGIVSVTAMATVINGIEQDFEQDMAELGADVIYVEKWPWVGGPGMKWWEYINRPEIEPELADVVVERSRFATAAVPVVDTNRPVKFEGKTISGIEVKGVTAEYPRVHVVNLERGYFFSELDNRSARSVAVIGAGIAEELFPVRDPLGKPIRVAGHRFQVIGVMEREGSGADDPQSADQQVFIPFEAFQRLFGTARRSVSVQIKVTSPEVMPIAKDELTGILRVARGLGALEDNDFEINEQQSLREQLAPVKLAIYLIGIFLTALALVVGGIGVMNIMFVSVRERTREIGIRKAVGAKRRTILLQFLIEAIIICLIGGIIGVLLSLPVAALIRMVLPAYVDVGTIALAFGICILVGVFFGLVPAWRAANSEPIEALRYE